MSNEREAFEAWAIKEDKYHVSGYNPNSDLGLAFQAGAEWQRSQSAPKAEQSAPAGARKVFICRDCEGVYSDEPVNQCDCMGREVYDEGYIVMLAAAPKAAPQPSDDVAKDAARYRWLIEEGDDMQWMNIIRVEVDDYPNLTAAIDAAMGVSDE